MKLIPLALFVLGTALFLYSLAKQGSGTTGLDRLPFTLAGIVVGFLMDVVAVIWLLMMLFSRL